MSDDAQTDDYGVDEDFELDVVSDNSSESRHYFDKVFGFAAAFVGHVAALEQELDRAYGPSIPPIGCEGEEPREPRDSPLYIDLFARTWMHMDGAVMGAVRHIWANRAEQPAVADCDPPIDEPILQLIHSQADFHALVYLYLKPYSGQAPLEHKDATLAAKRREAEKVGELAAILAQHTKKLPELFTDPNAIDDFWS